MNIYLFGTLPNRPGRDGAPTRAGGAQLQAEPPQQLALTVTGLYQVSPENAPHKPKLGGSPTNTNHYYTFLEVQY